MAEVEEDQFNGNDEIDMTSEDFREALKSRKSVSFSDGNEGKPIQKDQYVGRTLGVFTSGGDSQGMNAAVRAVVRMGIYLGCKVYFIHEGYQGMVDGGNNIRLATWASVSGIIGTGGTIIGSARCMEFRERSGRLKAAKNLIKNGINNLVCIGGDGTLTGANLFKLEWSSLLDELLETKQISQEEREASNYLKIVGLVGSIDNDFCGTDMTIGADSALHRIVEAVDAIVTTALSHQRCFVMEVMGRHCGYLALVASLACDADWVMIPEHPPEPGWEDKLCERLSYQREAGHRLNIIIMSEGAIDAQGKPITSNYVKDVVKKRLNFDTRVTVLGHVQRGGFASAFDRILGTRMGSEAVLQILQAKPESDPAVIAIKGYQICHIPLLEAVERTTAIAKAMADKDFNRVCELRGPSFQRNLQTSMQLSKIRPKLKPNDVHPFNLAVIHVGSPTSGVNAVVRSFVRHGLSKGCKIYVIRDGFAGLLRDEIRSIEWKSVYGWTNVGGSMLGSQRLEAKDAGFDRIAAVLKKYEINGLLVIGGFEAYRSVLQLKTARNEYPEFQIPLVCVPATISNNVPGTDFSIGCDTSLNEIVAICDKIKQSAIGYKRRVFVVETMGGYCGYLATMAGLACGADQAYIFEEPFTIADLVNDIDYLCKKMLSHQKSGVLIRNEKANQYYTTEFIFNLLTEEGKDAFNTRSNILGHMQQGGMPSPFDRTLAIKLAAKSLNYMLNILQISKRDGKAGLLNDDLSAVVIGVRNKQIAFTNVEVLKSETDFEHRIPSSEWWLSLRTLLRIMAHHDAAHFSELKTADIDEDIEDEDGMLKMWEN